jgi:hypothetical protein
VEVELIDPRCFVSTLGADRGSQFVVETVESCTVPGGHGSGTMHAPVFSLMYPPRFKHAGDESVDLASQIKALDKC